MVLVAQLAIVNQQHDRHGGELLANRSRRKFVPGRSSARFAGRLRHSFLNIGAFLDYEHRATGSCTVTNFENRLSMAEAGTWRARRPPRKHRHSYVKPPIAMPMRFMPWQLFRHFRKSGACHASNLRDVDYVAMPRALEQTARNMLRIRSYSDRPAAPDR